MAMVSMEPRSVQMTISSFHQVLAIVDRVVEESWLRPALLQQVGDPSIH